MPFLRRKQRGLGVERGRIRSLARLDIGVVGEIVGEEKSAAIPPASTDDIGLLAKISATGARADLRRCFHAFEITAQDYIDHAGDSVGPV